MVAHHGCGVGPGDGLQYVGDDSGVFSYLLAGSGDYYCRGVVQESPLRRHLVVSLLNALGWKNKASALRHYAARPEEALALVCGSPKN